MLQFPVQFSPSRCNRPLAAYSSNPKYFNDRLGAPGNVARKKMKKLRINAGNRERKGAVENCVCSSYLEEHRPAICLPNEQASCICSKTSEEESKSNCCRNPWSQGRNETFLPYCWNRENCSFCKFFTKIKELPNFQGFRISLKCSKILNTSISHYLARTIFKFLVPRIEIDEHDASSSPVAKSKHEPALSLFCRALSTTLGVPFSSHDSHVIHFTHISSGGCMAKREMEQGGKKKNRMSPVLGI